MTTIDIDEEVWEGLGDLIAQFGMLIVTGSEFEELERSARKAAVRLDNLEGSPVLHSEDHREDFRDVLLFITFASQLNEHLLRKAVFQLVIDEEAQTRDLHGRVHEMHAELCLDLLFAANEIESGLKGEIGQVKLMRNDLVHGLEDRLFHDPDQSYESQVDRAVRSTQKLMGMVDPYK